MSGKEKYKGEPKYKELEDKEKVLRVTMVENDLRLKTLNEQIAQIDKKLPLPEASVLERGRKSGKSSITTEVEDSLNRTSEQEYASASAGTVADGASADDGDVWHGVGISEKTKNTGAGARGGASRPVQEYKGYTASHTKVSREAESEAGKLLETVKKGRRVYVKEYILDGTDVNHVITIDKEKLGHWLQNHIDPDCPDWKHLSRLERINNKLYEKRISSDPKTPLVEYTGPKTFFPLRTEPKAILDMYSEFIDLNKDRIRYELRASLQGIHEFKSKKPVEFNKLRAMKGDIARATTERERQILRSKMIAYQKEISFSSHVSMNFQGKNGDNFRLGFTIPLDELVDASLHRWRGDQFFRT